MSIKGLRIEKKEITGNNGYCESGKATLEKFSLEW